MAQVLSPTRPDPTPGAAASTAQRATVRWLWRPYVLIPLVNVLVSLVYLSRDLLGQDLQPWNGARVLASVLLSAVGSSAFYYLVVHLTPHKKFWALLVSAVIAALLVAMHLVQFGYYTIFGAMVTSSVVDYARQYPMYSWTMFSDHMTLARSLACLLAFVGLTAYLGYHIVHAGPRPTQKQWSWAAALLIVPSYFASHAYLTVDQYCLRICCASLTSPRAINATFTPDRVELPPTKVTEPPNIVFFRLESIAREAVQLYNDQLPTTPFWAEFQKQHPGEMFVGQRHFTNSSCTDVAVMLIYTGAAADSSLELHRTLPMMWSYAKAAGYNTSAFFPFSIAWGDFEHRFPDRPGTISLDHLFHAANSGKPLIYDLSVNDDVIIDEAVRYQRDRQWQGPFFEIVELKMPHYLGAGASVNQLNDLDSADLPESQRKLTPYYSAIRHDDELMKRYLESMPPEVRDNTVVVVVSDHGDDLYGRMPRVDNYFQESARVPFWIVIPTKVQERLRPGAVEQLRQNLADVVTGNEDLVPTIVDLMGLRGAEPVARVLNKLPGQSLLDTKPAPEFQLMLNTGELRQWDREGFGLVLDNGRKHFVLWEGNPFLFDLEQDPMELTNLIDKPESRDDLRRVRHKVLSDPYLLRIAKKYGMPLHDAATTATP